MSEVLDDAVVETPLDAAETIIAEPSPMETVTSDDAPTEVESSDQAAERRRDWAERIRRETRLPGALRDRLAAAVEASDGASSEEPTLTVTQAANLFAEAVPSLLSLAERPHPTAAHPHGEGFFQAGAWSDDDAAQLAREQLRRTGFARETD